MNINTLGIKVTSDGVTQAARNLDALGNSADKTESKIKSLVNRIDEMVNKFVSSVAGTKALTQALTVVNNSTQASDAAIRSLATSVNALSTQIGSMSSQMGRSTTTITNNTTSIREHTAAMSDARAAARGLTGSLGALWLTYGSVAPLAAGAAIGASMKSIVSIGSEVENTLEAIRLKGEASISEVNDLRKAIMDIGQGIYGPQEVSKAFETLILAGLKAKDSINAIGAALNLATAGGTSIEKAAESLVTIGTAVGATSKEYDYLADGITKAANASLASVDSIAEAVKRASVVNKLYGASFEDILTQTAALAQLGIKNTAAGTAITNFYANSLGGTEKAKKALDALGFSFQDANGKAKPLVDTFEEFTQKLNKFDLKSQQKIITDIFGERALRDVEGLRDLVNQAAESTERLADGTLKYKNRLEEVQAEIQNSSGTASLVAAQQALTTKNQFESVANSLKTTFLGAFEELDPVLNNISKKLKEIVSSDEFKTAIQNIANAFVALAKILVDNIGLITAIAEGFIAVGAATAGGALFTKLIPVIGGAAIQMGLLAAGTTAATIATTGLGRAITMLPGIGMLFGLATAAVALYSAHANKATQSTTKLAEESMKLAEDYNSDFLKALDAENDRLKKINDQLDQGIELTKAQTNATKEQALEKLRAKNADAVSAAQKVVDEAQSKVDPVKAITDYTYKQSEAYKNLTKAKELLNKATAEQTATESKISAAVEENIRQSERQRASLKKMIDERDKAAKAAAGSATYAGKDDKAKGMNVFESFIDSQNKELATLKASKQAMQEFIDLGVDGDSKVYTAKAKATLASIAAEKATKNLSAAELKRYETLILTQAAELDKEKATKKQLEDYSELKKSVQDQINGNNLYFESIVNGTDKVVGKKGEQLVVSAANAKQTQEEIDKATALGKTLDEQIKLIDQINKLKTKGNTLASEAQSLVAQAEAMSEYGKSAKSTSYDLAAATVAQMNFKDAAGQIVAQNYLAEASFNTVAKALVNITKVGAQYADEQEKAEADSLLAFADNEKQKIQIKADAAKRIIQLNKDQALSAAMATGDPKAWETYEKLAEQSEKAIAQIDATTKTKMHNVELEDWKKTVNQIVDSGLEGFNTIFDKGTSIWDSLTKSIKDMFKKTVIDYIKKEFAKPILLNVVASVAGSLGLTGIANTASSMISGSSSGNSAISAASSASSIYSLLSKGFDGIGNSISQGITTALSKVGVSLSKESSAAISGYAATAAGIAAGYTLNKAISGQYSISSGVSNVQNIATVAASYFGPVASTIVGAVSGLLNRAFGMGPVETTSQGIRGTLSSSGTSGQSYQNWHQDGGWFRSDKNGTNTSALSSDITNTLTASFNSLMATTSAFAKNVDVSDTSLQGFTKTFDIAFGSDATKNQEAVTKFFTDLGDELATKLVPNIAEFALQGETASVTLQRLSETFSATNQIAAYLGKTVTEVWGSVGLSSDAARERLINLAGGIDALSTKVASYASSFLTDAEKLAPVQKAVEEALASLGLSGVTTREQFKNIVNSIDLTTASGAELFNNLMDLAPSFAQVADAADALKEKQLELLKSSLDIQSQIAELEKNTEQSAAVLAQQRQIELDAMDASLRPLQERLWALQDEKDAAEKAKAAQEAATKLWTSNLSLQSQIAELENNAAQSAAVLAEQRRIELSALDDSLKPLQERLWVLQDEAEAIKKANTIRNDSLAIQLQIATLEKNQSQVAAIVAEQRQIELAAMEDSLKPLQERLWGLQDEAEALQNYNKLRDDNLSLQLQIATLEKNQSQVTAVIAQQRKNELAAMDDSLKPFQERLWALQDEADAIEKSNKLRDDNLSLQLQIATLEKDQAGISSIVAEQRRIELAAMDDSLKPLQERLWMLQDEADATEKVNKLHNDSLALQLQIATLEKNQAVITGIVAEQRRIELSALDDSLKPLQQRLWALQDEQAAIEAANTLQKNKLGMLSTIADYEKNSAASAAILAEQRRTELEAMDASLRPLQERIYAIEDEKAAYEKSVAAAENAYTKLSDAINKQKDEVSASYATQIQAAKDATAAQLDFANAQKDNAQESLKALQDIFSTISDAIKSTIVESDTLDRYRRNAAQALVSNAAAMAKAGADVSKIEGLAAAIETLTKPSEQLFSTFEDYQFAQAVANDSLTSLKDSTQNQIDYAQLTIDRLDATITSIQTSGDNTVATLEKERDDQLAALDTSLELARSQLDALKGIDTSVLSLKDAMTAFASSLTSIVAQPTASTPVSSIPATTSSDPTTNLINSLYNAYLGRNAEQAGLAYYSNLLNSGALSVGEIANQISTSAEAKSYMNSFDVGTNYVNEDQVAMIHEGERIIPKADNAELMRRLDSESSQSETSSMKQCFDELKEIMVNGTVATNQKLSAMQNIFKKWDGDGLPTERNYDLNS